MTRLLRLMRVIHHRPMSLPRQHLPGPPRPRRQCHPGSCDPVVLSNRNPSASSSDAVAPLPSTMSTTTTTPRPESVLKRPSTFPFVLCLPDLTVIMSCKHRPSASVSHHRKLSSPHATHGKSKSVRLTLS